jgi:pSer/pThr/pTyr-binding forkhead associated (FHA) protein
MAFDPKDVALESGWALEGTDGNGNQVRLVFGDTELARTYLGITVGRHPSLCDRVIGDESVSRRHVRLSFAEARLLVEDLNSLNGTLVDENEAPVFERAPVRPGQVVTLGRVRLTVSRLTDRPQSARSVSDETH